MIGKRVTNTQQPPLVGLGNLAADTDDCISLGQGAPFYHPPVEYFESLSAGFSSPSPHQYSPDPGLPELRQSIVDKCKKDQQIDFDRDNIVVTPGANQAFFNSLLTITDPGDQVILLSPFYFNHYMACTSINVEPVEVALQDDFSITRSSLEDVVTDRTRAIVFVNPGNPTGAVHSVDDIKILGEFAEEHNLWVIADETYEYFTYDSSHTPAATIINSNLISISSFSKTFGIPGWRLGYYAGPSDFVLESIKVQDTIGICAPKPSQLLGIRLLDDRSELINQFSTLMESNHNLARDLIEEVSWLVDKPSQGAYYLFPRQTTGIQSMKLSKELITQHGVYIVPGDGFGIAGQKHFRISFANVEEEGLKESFSRLRSYSPN